MNRCPSMVLCLALLSLAACGPAVAVPEPGPTGRVATTPPTPLSATPRSTASQLQSAAPPSPSGAPSRTSLPGARRVVVLDPGHNGGNAAAGSQIRRQVPDGRGGMKDCNTTGTETESGYAEHAFNWDVAARVSVALSAAGVDVVLTRPDDTGVGPCVDERGRAGEDADADAVVSIHADGSAPQNSGFHVALSEPPLAPAQEGPARQLAVNLRDAMRTAGFPDSDYIGEDGLSPRNDLAGLNHATRPTVLVECANMRNAREAGLVGSPAGRQRYADAVTAGILAFLGR